jgi:hypothetical protein
MSFLMGYSTDDACWGREGTRTYRHCFGDLSQPSFPNVRQSGRRRELCFVRVRACIDHDRPGLSPTLLFTCRTARSDAGSSCRWPHAGRRGSQRAVSPGRSPQGPSRGQRASILRTDPGTTRVTRPPIIGPKRRSGSMHPARSTGRAEDPALVRRRIGVDSEVAMLVVRATEIPLELVKGRAKTSWRS